MELPSIARQRLQPAHLCVQLAKPTKNASRLERSRSRAEDLVAGLPDRSHGLPSLSRWTDVERDPAQDIRSPDVHGRKEGRGADDGEPKASIGQGPTPVVENLVGKVSGGLSRQESPHQATDGKWHESAISISATYIWFEPPLPVTPAGQGIVAPSATYLPAS